MLSDLNFPPLMSFSTQQIRNTLPFDVLTHPVAVGLDALSFDVTLRSLTLSLQICLTAKELGVCFFFLFNCLRESRDLFNCLYFAFLSFFFFLFLFFSVISELLPCTPRAQMQMNFIFYFLMKAQNTPRLALFLHNVKPNLSTVLKRTLPLSRNKAEISTIPQCHSLLYFFTMESRIYRPF